MKRFSYVLLIVLLAFASCAFFSDNDVAVVNGNKISKNELFRYIPEANFYALSPEEKQDQVDLVCNDYLKRYYLEDQGDLDSGNIKWEIRVWEIRELANGAYQHLIIDKILTPEAMEQLYDQLQYEINVSHLLIGFNNQRNLNERSREEAETLAMTIYEQLDTADFESLVLKYSDDISKEQNNGKLGWGRSGRWVPEFENAAFKLGPGEISGPVETSFGLHIIKMNERRILPIEPYENMKMELREIAFNKWRRSFSEREIAVFDSLSAANPVILNDTLLADFLDRFVRLSKNVFYSEQFTAFDILEIFDDTLRVGYIGNSPIDKDWIYQYLKMTSLHSPPRFTNESSFKSFIEQNRMGSLLYLAAKNLGLDRSEEYLQTRNVYLAKQSSDLFDKLYVFEMINPDQDALKNFYEEQKDALYSNPEAVRVREVLVKDSSLAVNILERARAGESMEDLATQYTQRNIGKKNKGLIPPVKKHQYSEMSLAAFNMKDGEIGGPFELEKYYSIIQRVEYVPGDHRSFNDVRYRLLTDFRNHYMAQKRTDQNKMLRDKYKVRVNPLILK